MTQPRIAFVQKCPSNQNYSKSFGIDGVTLDLASQKVKRVLKRDVDLEINPDDYDFIILIGSEAVKHFTKVTSVADYSGRECVPRPEFDNEKTKWLASISPAMLTFKPEARPAFEETVRQLKDIVSGISMEEDAEKDYQFFETPEELEKYLRFVLAGSWEVIAHDTETHAFDPRNGYLLGISMSHACDQGVYAHADTLTDENIELYKQVLYKFPAVLHNAKFDMHYLGYHVGIDWSKVIVHDTMIMHYVLDERQGTHGLKSLAIKYTNLGDYDRDLDEFKKEYCKAHKLKQDEFFYSLIPWDILKVYAAKDTDATLQLYHKFYPIIKANSRLEGLYENMLMPALKFLYEMEENGIPLSSERLVLAQNELYEVLQDLKGQLYSYDEVKELEKSTGNIFNPNSVVQLRTLLFDVLQLPIPDKTTSTGAISTDKEVLAELAQLHPIPKIINDIKKTTKLLNTYITKLIGNVHSDGRIRTSFNLSTTTSGRLSSSGTFNMQQLPRDNPIIKGCVKAPPGYKVVAADLTTAEVYYAAVLSKDRNLQAVFVNMQKDPDKYPDFHSNIAHMVFNLPCEPAMVKKLFPALRQAAKAITFGILYGSGPASVAEQVNIAKLEAGEVADCTKEDAIGYIEVYFKKFPRLKQWIADCHDTIRQQGFIYNFFGRKRRLHNISSSDRSVVAGEIRSGFNAIIQSVSSDHLLLGAIEAHEEIKKSGLDAKIFALVHDSVVAIVREDQVDAYSELLVSCLQRDRGCSIVGFPIGVEFDSEEGGSTDYSCGKLEEYYPELAAA
jgi:DNA polymerase I-like protein with 3'-5' exonuclease and polymerase domains